MRSADKLIAPARSPEKRLKGASVQHLRVKG